VLEKEMVIKIANFSICFNSTKYADSPPKVVIEVDVKMDIPENFQSDFGNLKIH